MTSRLLTPWDYARALDAYCDAQALEIDRLGKEYVFQQSQIKQFEKEYVAHKAEIVVLRADWKKDTHENGIVRAAAQQALEWFEWLNGDQTRAVQPSTDVQDALTAALKGEKP